MIRRIFTLAICSFLSLVLCAQRDLRIAEYLTCKDYASAKSSSMTKDEWDNSRHKHSWINKYGCKDVTLLLIQGKELSDYRLDVFKSLTLIPSDSISQDIEKRVMDDVGGSISHELNYRDSCLYYGLFQLSPVKGKKRYIFYRNNAMVPNSDGVLTLIYMEGSASIAQLRKMFKK